MVATNGAGDQRSKETSILELRMVQTVGQIDDGYGWNPKRINGWKGREGEEEEEREGGGEEKDGKMGERGKRQVTLSS
jgi:hypothetical protein